jgi:hypothetical protein
MNLSYTRRSGMISLRALQVLFAASWARVCSYRRSCLGKASQLGVQGCVGRVYSRTIAECGM